MKFVKTAFASEILRQIFFPIYGKKEKIYCQLLMNWSIFPKYDETRATKTMFFNKLL